MPTLFKSSFTSPATPSIKISPTLRVGVLRGGPSPEYDVSLKTGAHVLSQLALMCRPIDIFISRDGLWHMDGQVRTPERILKHVDVVWNALHGTYGEDGGVQEILRYLGIPYTGSERIPSALSMNKWITKQHALRTHIKTPVSAYVRQTDDIREKAQEIFNSIPHPLIVKPAMGGSSIGLYFVETYSQILSALETILSVYDAAVVEEYISGRDATCAVLNDFRGKAVYALPIVEIYKDVNRKTYDQYAKMEKENKHVSPGNFTTAEKKEMERIASHMHNSLGLSHYSRTDFLVSPRRGVYFLEINSLPELTPHSLFQTSLESVGITSQDFIAHILTLTLN